MGVSPKRLDGWEPTWETTYTYDDAGRLVRSVTRMVEPEWDDRTRHRVFGLDQHDRDCCPGCGLHESVIANPDKHGFDINDDTCPVCAVYEQHQRVLKDRDEEFERKHPDLRPASPRPGDGRHTTLQPLTAEEMAQRRAQQLEGGKTNGHRPAARGTRGSGGT